MNIHIGSRSAFDSGVSQLDLEYKPERFSHSAIGGPKTARIKVNGNDNDLWQLIELIRCPIDIYSDSGECLWWGWIADIDATAKASGGSFERVKIGATIDTMYNSIAVAYNKVDVSTGLQERDTTTWADDLLSQSEYGIRELLWSSSSATTTHANAARDMRLQQSRYPQAIIVPVDDTNSGGVITCRGWWDTMSWRYYGNSGTATVDTANQCGTIMISKGQFFGNVLIDVTSGITIREERDGDGSAMYELLEMLKMGTTNYRRMLVEIDKNRNVRIYEEPAKSSTTYQLLASGGAIDKGGGEIRRELAPSLLAGNWAKWKDIIPPSVDTTILSDPGVVFVEDCEFDIEKNKLIVTPRGDLDPWNFPRTKDG